MKANGRNVCLFLSLNAPFPQLYFVYFTVCMVCEEIIKFDIDIYTYII